MEVRVLPDSAFGLIHGKAGIIRRADGSAISFLGSVNESASAWRVNYELLWEDSDPETVAWVQEEFDALWNDARAVDLACCPFITQDVERIISRKVIEPADLEGLSDSTTAAAAAAGRITGLSPRTRIGRTKNILLAWLWNGIGSAVHALSWPIRSAWGKPSSSQWPRMLMALDDPDGGPILVLAPKPLLQQWQDELMELLLLPSARWNGRAWVDENNWNIHPKGPKSLGKCPRRIGLVSQGLVVRGLSEAVNQLAVPAIHVRHCR